MPSPFPPALAVSDRAAPAPWRIGAAIALILGLASPAAALTVDLVNGIWDHSCASGTTASTGWDSAYRCGSITDGTLTATLEMSFFGTATGHASNADFLSSTAFEGFLMGNQTDSGNTGSTLVNYQQWVFTVDRSALLRDLTVTDLDEGGWRDAVGLEQFTGSFAGAGQHDDLNVTRGSALTEVEAFGMKYYEATGNGNTLLNPDNALVANSDGAVDGFAVYLFSTGTGGAQHGVGLDATFELSLPSPVPIPGALVLLLSGLAGFGVLRRRARPA